MPQNLVFTALPWRNISGRNMLSVYVTIRLDESYTKLSKYPDIINWPSLISNSKLLLQWNGGIPKEIKFKSDVDAEIYKKLFTGNVDVDAYKPVDQTSYKIKSYPVKHVLGFLQSTYNQVGNAKPDDVPTEKYFTDEWKDLTKISDYSINIPDNPRDLNKVTEDTFLNKTAGRARLRKYFDGNKVFPFRNEPQPETDFAQLRNFHEVNAKPSSPAPLPPPEFEYHDILTALNAYPFMLRKTGLVIDIEVDDAMSGLPEKGNVRVIPQNIDFSIATSVSSPATSYKKTANGFYADSDPKSAIQNGMLTINNGDYTLVQVDTDGAALKLCNQIDNLQQLKAKHLFSLASVGLPVNSVPLQNIYENDSQRDEGLPAVRSAGIGIARNGLAGNVYEKFIRTRKLNNSLLTKMGPVAGLKGNNATFILPSDTLSADDITRGYRMDISYDQLNPKWHSLHKRKETFSFITLSNTKEKLAANDGGEGFIQLAMSTQKGDDAKKLGEVMARWEGWSLSIPKPGNSINDPDSGKPLLSNKEEELKTASHPQFRLNAEFSHVEGSLPMLRFGRKYMVKLRTVDLAGNSVPLEKTADPNSILAGIKYLRYDPVPAPVLVLGNKNRDGESIEHMVIRSNEGVTPDNYENTNTVPGKTFPGSSIRHLKAPRTSQHVAELHSKFDAAFGSGNIAAAKEMYTYITSKDKEGNLPTVYDPAGPPQIVVDGNTKNIALDYLADPMAAGIVFALDKKSDAIGSFKQGVLLRYSFYFDDEVNDANANAEINVEKWKEPKSIRIKLQEGSGDPSWDKGSRLLNIFLPKGIKITINYACFWRPDDVDKISGMSQWLFPDNSSSIARNKARAGRHWMFSPWRKLTLTHAVQQPLVAPEIKSISTVRTYGQTIANLSSNISVHGKSTDKVDLMASWIEFKDEIGEPRPIPQYSDAHISLPEIVKEEFKKASAHVKDIPVNYHDTELLSGQFPIQHFFGDTKYRKVSYKPVATTRYREYFTELLKKNPAMSIIKEGKDNTIDILSTARPLAPSIEYVIPSFNWVKNKNASLEVHVRTGNIRVYMKRPWFTSGEGERIAVIVNSPVKESAHDERFVTVWGKDPVFIAGDLANEYPTVAAFPFSAQAEAYVSIEESPTYKVGALAYNVVFDEDRQLYYADIPVVINQSYFPFVKLALARYQKNSVRVGMESDCCLSKIVHTDWIQVVPARTTAVDVKGSKINVAVAGTAPFAGSSGSNLFTLPNIARTVFEISIENTTFAKTDEAFISINDRKTHTIEFYNSYDVTPDMISGNQINFKKEIDLPAALNGKSYRVVIKEFEMHQFDPLRVPINEFLPGTDPHPHFKMNGRLVFMDVFELGSSLPIE